VPEHPYAGVLHHVVSVIRVAGVPKREVVHAWIVQRQKLAQRISIT
jgi:hypothetical protein